MPADAVKFEPVPHQGKGLSSSQLLLKLFYGGAGHLNKLPALKTDQMIVVRMAVEMLIARDAVLALDQAADAAVAKQL